MARKGFGQGFKRKSVTVEAAGPGAAGRTEVQFVIRPYRGCDGRHDIAWNDQTGFMKAALWHDPGKRYDKSRRGSHEVGSVHQDLAICVRLRELAGFDLDPERRTCRQAPDQNFVCLVVWEWPEQAA